MKNAEDYKVIFNLLHNYGWLVADYGKGQKWGSPADIYAESMDGAFFMIIDDGSVSPFDTIYHIYCGSKNGKIFEGRIMNTDDFIDAMRLLGFNQEFNLNFINIKKN